jgi:adenylosuccinate lyase
MLSLKGMRYSNEIVDAIWSESAIARSRIVIEERWLKSLADLRIVSTPPSIDRVGVAARSKEIEKTTNHDVVSMVMALEEHLIDVGYRDHNMVHFGLTSSDICDTALSISYNQSFSFLMWELDRLIREMCSVTLDGSVVARTHGADTGIRVPIAVRMSKMASELSDIDSAIRNLKFYGKLSGPIGLSDAFDMHRTCEQVTLSALCLESHPASTQIIPRHVYADYHMKLAMLGKVLSRVASSIRLAILAGDLSIARVPGEIGSSAMPHKVNPWQLERVAGMSRILDSHAMSALANIDLWLERDISHSCVERVNPPLSFTLLSVMINDIIGYIPRLQVIDKPPASDPYKTLNELVLRHRGWFGNGKTRAECHKIVESGSD